MSNQLSPSDLMRQGVLTSRSYLISAIRIIDEELGEGYAKEHPELISGFMNNAVLDYGVGMISQRIEWLTDAAEGSNVATAPDFHVSPDHQVIANIVTAASNKIAVECTCRVDHPHHGLAKSLLQAWIANHPGHTRKEHILVLNVFVWLANTLESKE